MNREKEKHEKQSVGLIEADAPKLKISNFMRVMADDAVAGPTQVEAMVRKQSAQRQKNHDMRNLARYYLSTVCMHVCMCVCMCVFYLGQLLGVLIASSRRNISDCNICSFATSLHRLDGRKLTPEERKLKTQKKFMEDTSSKVCVALFRFMLHMLPHTGCCLMNEDVGLPVPE